MSPRHFFVGLMVVAAGARAQSTTGDIRGRVAADGIALANVQVTATPTAMPIARTVRSGPDGVFILSTLAPGRYTIRLTSIGRRPLELRGIEVKLGQTTGLADVVMEPATTTLSPIVVESARLTVDPVRTTFGLTLSSDEMAALPGDRDYKSRMAMAPQVNTSFNGDPPNSGGSTGLENMYFIDGVNVTSPYRASGGTSLPYNFVKSVEVRAGGYEAQFGRALGAIVNAVTYTGTNEFESEAFGFFGNGALAAKSKNVPSIQETGVVSYDAGGRVGGPIVRDHLWFAGAYNARVATSDRSIATFGSFKDRARADIFATKLSWLVGPSATVEASIFGDPSVHHAVEPPSYLAANRPLNPDPFLQLSETGGVSTSIRATIAAGPAVIEVSAGRSTGRENLTGDTPTARSDYPTVDWRAGTISGGVPFPSLIAQARNTYALKGSLDWGAHASVGGVEYEDAVVSNLGSPSQYFLDAYGPDSFRLGFTNIVGAYHNVTPTAYVQDAWRITPRLTLNLGLRWSQQRFTAAGLGDGQHFNGEWQPRVGFNWVLNERATRRLFGSYGRYYQELPLNVAVLYLGDFIGYTNVYRRDPRVTRTTPIDSVDFSTPASWYLKSDPSVTGDRFDEFTIGYEERFASGGRLALRAVRRTLGSAYQQGIDPTTTQYFFLGTPGEGDLSFLPAAKRDYSALEVEWDGAWRKLRYGASYVLSRTWGNYPGQFGSDFYFGNPGIDYGLTVPEQAKNSTGLLPNDRTHVIKVTGAVDATSTLRLGLFATWMSGTPLNEFGASPECSTCFPVFLVQRGSAGRTPAVYDVNLRATYLLGLAHQTRVVIDLAHIGNPQAVVRRDQQRFNEIDPHGVQITPNFNYGQPLLYQPPMAAKLGVEIRW